MKISPTVSCLILLITVSIIFSSCISINRNVTVNRDGSGSEIMTIKFNKVFYEMMASMSSLMDSTRRQGYLDSLYSDEIFIDKTKSMYDTTQGVKLVDIYSFKDPDSSNSFVVKYDFDNLIKIGSSMVNLNSDNHGNNDDNAIVTYKKEGNEIVFNYLFEETLPKKTIPGDSLAPSNDSLNEQMKNSMSELFKGGSFTFEIQFPYEVISSNAKYSEGNRLVWDYTISDLMTSGKMNLEAVLKDN